MSRMSDQQPWPTTEGDAWNARESGGTGRGRDGQVMSWDRGAGYGGRRAHSPGRGDRGAAPSTVGATGGGVGAQVADLSALTAVQSTNISGPNPGPEQIGATIYQNSVGFTCYTGSPSYIDYNVAGYKFLNALIGIP